MNLSDLGEFGLIADLHSRMHDWSGGVRLGIGDDAAVLNSLQTPIVTCDALVEGVHFRRDWTSARALGRKSMAVNVSDLAAMGAVPVAAFISLAVSENDSVEWIRELYEGFEAEAQEHLFTIAGGDTVKSLGGTMISVTLIGEVYNPERGPVLRSGAKPGDVLMVTNSVGGSAAGLALLLNPEVRVSEWVRNFTLREHLEPMACQHQMKFLLDKFPAAWHAALDISDGIVGDAGHMAKRSNVSIEIDVEKLPISVACVEVANALHQDQVEWALSGGEDYELLIAVSPESAEEIFQFAENSEDLGHFSIIGRCLEPESGGPTVKVLENGKIRPVKGAWTHF